jgi:hypothetical protein
MADEESLPKPEPDKRRGDFVFLPPKELPDSSICPDQKPVIKPVRTVDITIPVNEEDTKLGKFSKLAENEEFREYSGELEKLDAAYARGDLEGLFNGTVLMDDETEVKDTIKITELFSELHQHGLIEMGLVLRGHDGEVLKNSFLRGLPEEYGDTIEDNQGNTIPTAGLKISGASKLKI